MKALILITMLVLSGGVCAAQDPSPQSGNAAPGVTIVESDWRRRLARNPALDEDPLRSLEAQARAERIRSQALEQNRIRAAAGKDQSPLPSRNAPSRSQPFNPTYPYRYVYRIKITNTGVKKIRGLVWEYVFVDPSTGSEVSRRRFTSNAIIHPGKSKRLFGHSVIPPTGSIDASKAGEQPEGQHAEQIVITKIYYDDNSVWERALN
jgi:hypothetical protein